MDAKEIIRTYPEIGTLDRLTLSSRKDDRLYKSQLVKKLELGRTKERLESLEAREDEVDSQMSVLSWSIIGIIVMLIIVCLVIVFLVKSDIINIVLPTITGVIICLIIFFRYKYVVPRRVDLHLEKNKIINQIDSILRVHPTIDSEYRDLEFELSRY